MKILPTRHVLISASKAWAQRFHSKMNLHFTLACGCLLSLAGIASAQPTEESAIRQQRKLSNEAIARQDTAALGQYWLDDVHVLTSRSTSLNGKAANLIAFQNEFKLKEKLLYVRTPTAVEVFTKWNMAGEYGRWTGTWISNGETIRVSGSYYAKWHYQNGKWKIRSEVYVPATCEGGQYCNTSPVPESKGSAIVVQNYYYPKPGKAAEVMATRRRASQVRAQLGLPVGRILQRTSASNTQPYIVWECEYPSVQARENDLVLIDQSKEFSEVQDHMSTLLEKFDREVWIIKDIN